MEYINTGIALLSLLAVIYVGYIQQSQIKTLKAFNEIFKIEDVKKYVELHKEKTQMEKEKELKELSESLTASNKNEIQKLNITYLKDKTELNKVKAIYSGLMIMLAYFIDQGKFSKAEISVVLARVMTKELRLETQSHLAKIRVNDKPIGSFEPKGLDWIESLDLGDLEFLPSENASKKDSK